MLIIPTVHLVYAPVVALVAVFAHVTHKKGPSSGRGVGSLDVARLAFAVAALIVRVASVVPSEYWPPESTKSRVEVVTGDSDGDP